MSTLTGPLPTAKAVPSSTAAAGMVSLPAVSLSWPASTPHPISPAITRTATTTTDVHRVTARRFSRASCCSTIRFAAARSFVPLLITHPYLAVHGEPGPRTPQQNPGQDKETDVAQEIPGVLRALSGTQRPTPAEAAAVDLQPASPRRH